MSFVQCPLTSLSWSHEKISASVHHSLTPRGQAQPACPPLGEATPRIKDAWDLFEAGEVRYTDTEMSVLREYVFILTDP